jgi:predicted class III extradiol MEMO1 family dioxygenase/AMMECR1 domain-containing protein
MPKTRRYKKNYRTRRKQKGRGIIPTPSSNEIATLWESFLTQFPRNNVTQDKRLFFVPHAGIEYSGYTALHALSTMIPNPTHIRIYITDHGAGLNDHSFRINYEILRYRYPNAMITPHILSNADTIDTLQTFLQDLGNVIVFTSDMSHENDKSSQYVLMQEAPLINAILTSTISRAIEEIKQNTLCGPMNMKMFLELCSARREKPILCWYDNSKGRGTQWSTQKQGYIVSYLSMTTSRNNTEVMQKHMRWKEQMHNTFVVSRLADSNVELPSVFRITTPCGLFITITDEWGKTRACIGEFYNPDNPLISLYDHILSILPRLPIDAQTRWNKPFITGEKLYSELTIMDTIKKPIAIKTFLEQSPQKEHVYTYTCNTGTGTFIPSVWEENKWTPEEYLDELKEKAGCSRNSNGMLMYIRCYVVS